MFVIILSTTSGTGFCREAESLYLYIILSIDLKKNCLLSHTHTHTHKTDYLVTRVILSILIFRPDSYIIQYCSKCSVISNKGRAETPLQMGLQILLKAYV